MDVLTQPAQQRRELAGCDLAVDVGQVGRSRSHSMAEYMSPSV